MNNYIELVNNKLDEFIQIEYPQTIPYIPKLNYNKNLTGVFIMIKKVDEKNAKCR